MFSPQGNGMVFNQWWSCFESIVQYERDDYGVYELGDDLMNTVYYGSGKVKSRLLDHLNKKECPMAQYYRIEYCISEQECREKERQLLEEYSKTHAGNLPMYNEKDMIIKKPKLWKKPTKSRKTR